MNRTKKNNIPFSKLSGIGNDFVVLKNLNGKLKIKNRRQFAKSVCDRHFGVGADGLVILEPSQQADLKWDFYNADGSTAEMCGNAARCIGRLIGKKIIILETHSGNVLIRTNPESVSVEFKTPKILKHDISVEGFKGSFVDSGVPHFVIKVPQIKAESLMASAQRIRRHRVFGPRGTNVTFYSTRGRHWRVSTFERGVENFTLACGTGALAAGAIFQTKNPSAKNLKIEMPGGPLNLFFDPKKIILQGSATHLFDGVITL